MEPMARKNIILLCADELRGDCLGAVGENPDVRTPHLDALAARGALFRKHYCVMPKCVPSRISMMTGRYSHTDGFRTITQHLPAGRPDLVSSLKQAGYGVAVFGINHCWEDGFERVMDVHAWSEPYKRHWGPDSPYRNPPPETTSRAVPAMPRSYDYEGCGRVWFDDLVTRCAVEFITERMDRSRPWFVQVNLQSPHPPYRVEEPWFSSFDRDAIRPWPHELPRNAPLPMQVQREVRTDPETHSAWLKEIQATYYGMIGKTDQLLGEVIQALDDTGLMEDSLVVFFSDHGDYAGQYGLIEKWDTHFAEPLIRVAFSMTGEGVPSGTVVDSFSQHIDLGPTALDWLGLPQLPNAHGTSLLRTLAGEESREAVFVSGGHESGMRRRLPLGLADRHDPQTGDAWLDGKQETYLRHPDAMARAKCVRTHRHKLVVREVGGNELYDLGSDPWEMDNRFGDPALREVERELLLRLVEWGLATDPDTPEQLEFGA